jgi:hypothetical protein
MFFVSNPTFKSSATGNRGAQARFGADRPHYSSYPYRSADPYYQTTQLPDSFGRMYDAGPAAPTVFHQSRSHSLQQNAQQRQIEANALALRASLAAQAAAREATKASISAKLASDAFKISQDSSKSLKLRNDSYNYGLNRKESALFHKKHANHAYTTSTILGQDQLATLDEAAELSYKAALAAEYEKAEMARQAQRNKDEAGPSQQKDPYKGKSNYKSKHHTYKSGKEPSSSQAHPTKNNSNLKSNQKASDTKGQPSSQPRLANVSIRDGKTKLKQPIIETLYYDEGAHLYAPITPLLKPGKGIPEVIREFDTGEKLTYLPNKVCEIAFWDPNGKRIVFRDPEGNPTSSLEYPRPVLGAVTKVTKELQGQKYHYTIFAKGCDTREFDIPIEWL